MINCRSLNTDDNDAETTSDIINRVSDLITTLLSTHHINEKRAQEGKPLANCVLFRGCSRAPDFPEFDSFHNLNWNPVMMARTCIISGIGQSLDFEIIEAPIEEICIEDVSSIEKDLSLFLDNLRSHPDCTLAFFHIKSVDEASHEQDYLYKVSLIESIDRIIGIAIQKLTKEFESDEFRIVVTGDHSTLCRIGEHSCEPVPFLVSEPLIHSNCKIIENHRLQISISKCFSSNNIGRFSGESVIGFLENLLLN